MSLLFLPMVHWPNKERPAKWAIMQLRKNKGALLCLSVKCIFQISGHPIKKISCPNS
jgi:hypothetical protein